MPGINIIDDVYNRLQALFGTDAAQQFTMEFPGRVLDPATYAYPVKNVFAELTKPEPVAEAEFRLSNDLFDIVQVSGGPNGRTLSNQWQYALESLVPAIEQVQVQFMQDRQRIRTWLKEEVTVTLPDATGKPVEQQMSRMDLYDTLSARYTQAADKWRQDKEDRYDAALKDPDPQTALDEYAKWVSREAPVRDQELEALFSDLVVRGFYHEVREMLGLIDVASPAEALEEAKARMRASVASTVDETQSFWPVQLSPQDWFTSLDTNFAPIDLLLDPQNLQTELVTKQSELDQLQEQYTLLTNAQSGDVATLQKAVDTAQTDLDTAMNAALGSYFATALAIARVVAEAEGGGGSTGLLAALKSAKIGSISPGAAPPQSANDVQDLLNKALAVNAAQQTLTAAAGRLADLQGQLAGAKASNQSEGLTAMQSHMDSLRSEIKYLQSLLNSSTAASTLQASFNAAAGTFDASKSPAFIKAVGTTTKDTSPTTGANVLPDTIPGDWATIIVEHSANSSNEATNLVTSSHVSKTDVDLFIGGYSSQSSSSSSESSTSLHASSLNIQLGFLATKVEINRSGWFDPGLFESTIGMYHVDADTAHRTLISDGTLLSSNPPPASTNQDNVLPAYPTAFVIVKDVTIVVTNTNLDTNTWGSFTQAASSASGGFLCFSTASASSSSAQHNGAITASTADTLIIRIPQPQVIAWFLEAVARDRSNDYQKLPDDFLPAASGPAAADGQVAGAPGPRLALHGNGEIGDGVGASRGSGDLANGAGTPHTNGVAEPAAS